MQTEWIFPGSQTVELLPLLYLLLTKFRAPFLEPPGLSLPALNVFPLKLSIFLSCGVKESVLLLYCLEEN